MNRRRLAAVMIVAGTAILAAWMAWPPAGAPPSGPAGETPPGAASRVQEAEALAKTEGRAAAAVRANRDGPRGPGRGGAGGCGHGVGPARIGGEKRRPGHA